MRLSADRDRCGVVNDQLGWSRAYARILADAILAIARKLVLPDGKNASPE